MHTLPNLPAGLPRTLRRSAFPRHPATQEVRPDRDKTSMATVASVLPANAGEAPLAAQACLADPHAANAPRCRPVRSCGAQPPRRLVPLHQRYRRPASARCHCPRPTRCRIARHMSRCPHNCLRPTNHETQSQDRPRHPPPGWRQDPMQRETTLSDRRPVHPPTWAIARPACIVTDCRTTSRRLIHRPNVSPRAL